MLSGNSNAVAHKVKEMVGHGNWLPWLKENCKGISDKTAQRYMTLAKFDNVSDDVLVKEFDDVFFPANNDFIYAKALLSGLVFADSDFTIVKTG